MECIIDAIDLETLGIKYTNVLQAKDGIYHVIDELEDKITINNITYEYDKLSYPVVNIKDEVIILPYKSISDREYVRKFMKFLKYAKFKPMRNNNMNYGEKEINIDGNVVNIRFDLLDNGFVKCIIDKDGFVTEDELSLDEYYSAYDFMIGQNYISEH